MPSDKLDLILGIVGTISMMALIAYTVYGILEAIY